LRRDFIFIFISRLFFFLTEKYSGSGVAEENASSDESVIVQITDNVLLSNDKLNKK